MRNSKNETVHKVLMNTYFILSLVTILAGIMILAMKVCFASKCEEFSICFGLVSVKRNVVIEEKEFHSTLKENIQELTQMRSEIDRG